MALIIIEKCCDCGGENLEAYEKFNRICRECHRKRISRKAGKQKLQAIEYKGGKCSICGYNEFPSAMDFHHLDPKVKEFSLQRARYRPFEEIKEELDKCILVCARCHREIHATEQLVKDYKPMKQRIYDSKSEYECKQCGKKFEGSSIKNRIYCSKECASKSIAEKCSKVENKPNKEQLQELIDSKPWTTIGDMFGVSDNAVRKWAKTLGISRTPGVKIKINSRKGLLTLQEDGTKICGSCHRIMLERDFQKCSTSPDGLDAKCRGCCSLQDAARWSKKKLQVEAPKGEVN